MKEKFEYDKHFIISHKKEITEIIMKGEPNPEGVPEELIPFANLVACTTQIPFYLVGIMDNNSMFRTPSSRLPFIYELGGIAEYLVDFFQDEDLRDLILSLVDVKLFSKAFNSVYYSNLRQYKGLLSDDDLCKLQLRHDQIIIDITNNQEMFDGLILNKRTDVLVSFKSTYKYLERICFFMWCIKDKVAGKDFSLSDINYVRKEYNTFKSTSWFTLLEQYLDVPDTEEGAEQINLMFETIIDDYTGVKDEDARNVLKMAIWIFGMILESVKLREKYVVEDDDRKNIVGVVIPEEKSYDEKRIEIAADYLIENHYLQEGQRQKFIKLMNGEGDCKIEFGNGKSAKNESKKTGGKAILYWIIRYIKEPENLNGKRAGSQSIAEKFYFLNNEEPCNWSSLSGTGKKTNVDDMFKSLCEKEKKREIKDGLQKIIDAGKSESPASSND